MTIEAHAVHIQNLQNQISDLAEECQSHHKEALEATREVHRRIDDFTKIMMQLAEVNKDVQSVMAHTRVLESDKKEFDKRLVVLEKDSDSNTETIKGIKKLGWTVITSVGGLIGFAVWQLILMGPK